MTQHNYLASCKSRLFNMILPAASDNGDAQLMAEAAKIEALIVIAESLEKLAKCTFKDTLLVQKP